MSPKRRLLSRQTSLSVVLSFMSKGENLQSFWRVAEDGGPPGHLAHPDVANEQAYMAYGAA